MTQREKLIKLLRETFDYTRGVCIDFDEAVEINADHLLESGVIVPPCKIGDTVYFPMETNGKCEPYVDVGTVFTIKIDERHTVWISARYESGLRYYHTSDNFGKTVFLTREEAEKALAERIEKNG